MPRDKPVTKQPPAFSVTRRVNMGARAPHEPLSKEEMISEIPGKPFRTSTEARNWISSHGDGKYVYIIRDRSGKAVAQLSRKENGSWNQINAAGYYNPDGSSYTIGKPTNGHPCSICRQFICQHDHPSNTSSDY